MTSLSADVQDLIRKFRVLSEFETDRRFLQFAEGVEVHHRNFSELREEVCRLQAELVKAKDDISSLQLKLKNAKELVDFEIKRRAIIEKEKYDLQHQISLVLEMLGKDNINETKEKLQLLSSNLSGYYIGAEGARRSIKESISPNHLSTIKEGADTQDSIVTISDIDITEEDELEFSKTRSGRMYRKSQSSISHNRSGSKRAASPSRNQSGSRKLLKSEEQDKENDQNSCNKGTQENVIEMAHQRIIAYPSAPPLSSGENFLDIPENKFHGCVRGNTISYPVGSHQHVKVQVHTPASGIYLSPGNSPLVRNYSSSKVNMRPHSFISKPFYWADHCQPCGKRIRFGKSAMKCLDCRTTTHSECKDSVPLPCIPHALTPGNKGQGTIADFTPSFPPMVPGIVIHCTNEVENRGLIEVGIYRASGAISQVRELKDAFLRGKGTPNLSRVEIHVVCDIVKDFLRSLKEPLITRTLWKDFTCAVEKTEPQDVCVALYQAISDLPRPNRDTLAWLICHLQRVAESVECKMPLSNLAKVFGPTVIGYSVAEPEADTIYRETTQQQMVMEKLLEISPDYWRTFINVTDESINNKFSTPDKGAFPSSGTKRRSILSMTPIPAREGATPKIFRHRK